MAPTNPHPHGPRSDGGAAAGPIAAEPGRRRRFFQLSARRCAATLSWLALALLAPCEPGLADDAGEVWASDSLSPSVRATLVRAHAIALDRVRTLASCSTLFADLEADGETCLAQTVYLAVHGRAEEGVCRSGVMAFTAVGSAVTRVCSWFARVDDERAAMILIHEALHRAGLDEWPHDPDGLTPQGINEMVGAGCGHKAARRAAAVTVASSEAPTEVGGG